MTLIDKVAYGMDSFEKKRLISDFADTIYNVAREKINGIKLKIRINDKQIKRE